MALETVTYVGDLTATNPLGSDLKSTLDDHIRNVKKSLRQSFTGFTGAILVTGVDGGAVNTYTLTPTTALSGYVAKMVVEFTPNVTNTGDSTLNISGLGAKSVYSVSGAVLTSGDLVSGYYYLAVYDGTQFRLLSTTKNYIDQLAIVAGNMPTGGTTSQALIKSGATNYDAAWSSLKTVNSNSLIGSGDIAITPPALILLATLTPTAAANVDFLTTFSSTYDNYLIIGDGLKPAANDTLVFRFANAGTADSGSNYAGAANTTANNVTATATSFNLIANITSAGIGAGFVLSVRNANDATNIKTFDSQAQGQNAATPSWGLWGSAGVYVAANAISGIRFFWSGASNFSATGKIRVYGYSNT